MVTQQPKEIPESPQVVFSDEAAVFSVNSEKTETISILITTPNFSKSLEKTFEFNLDEKVWRAKQTVLIEFANHPDLRDPLNFGFYMPPFSGRAGKFLDEERFLREYPMNANNYRLEFRYKRRIFRHIQLQDERKLQKINTKKYRKKFLEAILSRNLSSMEKALNKGLDPNFHDEKSGETPINTAAKLDNCLELLKLLVQYGAYLDFRSKDGRTALHTVAVIGKIDALKNLLDLGASPNCKDEKGLSPLYSSIIAGSNPVISEILLKERAEIGVTDLHGSTEIHQACRLGHVQHLEHLIFYGANINSANASGNTPLHICGLENRESCARVLLFRGAKRTLTNYAQQSAYDVAILANHFEVAQLINDFNESQVKEFTDQPEFSNRRRSKKSSFKNNENSSSLPSSPVSSGRLFNAISTPNMHTLGLQRQRKQSATSLPDMLEDYTDSESDSDDDENLKPVSKGRTFSAAGVGTKRSPAPIKINPNGAATLRTRLYASVPGREFVAISDYEPAHPGELMIKKGDIVEILYVGEGGFWEGRIKGRAGWFPSYCVQELKKGDTLRAKQRSWFGKKNSPMELIDKAIHSEAPKARLVTLKRSDKGFGFQLRGASSHVPHIEFNPTPQFPALQYIGEVDKNGVAEKAGLRPGDFVLEINNENVINATHSYAVSLISKGGKSLSVKVITVAPESVSPELAALNGIKNTTTDNISVKGMESGKKAPPPPPTRSNSTVLSRFSRENSEHSVFSEGAVTVKAETVVLNKQTSKTNNAAGMWAGNAYRLQANNDERTAQEENIAVAMGKKDKGSTHAFAAEFDERFKIITKQVNVDTSRYPPVNPKPVNPKPVNPKPQRVASSRGSSSSSLNSSSASSTSNDTPKVARKATPPGYDYTLDSLRRGRANSLGRGDNNGRPKSMIVPNSTTLVLENRYDQQFQAELNRRNSRNADPRYGSDPRLADPRLRDMRLRDPRLNDPRLAQDRRLQDPRLNDPRLQDPRLRDPRFADPRFGGKLNKQMFTNGDDMLAYQHRRNTMIANYIEDQRFNSLRRTSKGGSGSLPLHQTQIQRDMRFARTQSEYFDRDFTDQQQSNFDFLRGQSEPFRAPTSNRPSSNSSDVNVKVNRPEECRVGQEFPVNNMAPRADGLTLQTQASSDGLIRSQNQRQRDAQHKNFSAMPPPPPPPPPVLLEVKSHSASALPPPPPDYLDNDPVPTSPAPATKGNDFLGDSILNAVAARSARMRNIEAEIEKNKVKKDGDSDSVGSIGKSSLQSADSALGSEGAGLYNSSSSVSLDSAGSKDSGFDNDGVIDHSSALSQAIALRAAKMAAKESCVTPACHLPSTKELPEPQKNVIEERNLLKPSQLKCKDLNPVDFDKGYDSPTCRLRTKSDVPPPTTKPKPKRSATVTSVQALSPVKNSLTPLSPDKNNNRAQLSEDSATSYLDVIIADAEASIDYDLISITSTSSNGDEKNNSWKIKNSGKPVISVDKDKPNTDLDLPDDLPPPPLEFLDVDSTDVVETKDGNISQHSAKDDSVVGNVNVPDALTSKPILDWSIDDVCCWLDHLNLSQYKTTFTENDIEGKHLPELSKDELKELGVSKLGHRMTLHDAIARLNVKN